MDCQPDASEKSGRQSSCRQTIKTTDSVDAPLRTTVAHGVAKTAKHARWGARELWSLGDVSRESARAFEDAQGNFVAKGLNSKHEGKRFTVKWSLRLGSRPLGGA